MPVAVADYTVFNVLVHLCPRAREANGALHPYPDAWEPAVGQPSVPPIAQTKNNLDRLARSSWQGGMEKRKRGSFSSGGRAPIRSFASVDEMESADGGRCPVLNCQRGSLAAIAVEGREKRRQLNEQWDWVEGGTAPMISGYYVKRQFDWLFRAIVLDFQPVRDSVFNSAREIHKEIERKRAESFAWRPTMKSSIPRWKELLLGPLHALVPPRLGTGHRRVGASASVRPSRHRSAAGRWERGARTLM